MVKRQRTSDFAYDLKDIPRQLCEETLEPFFKHMLKVVCDYNQDKFDYIIKWLAHLVQQPNAPVGTALVLRGEKSVDIDNIVNTFGSLVGPHFKHLATNGGLPSPFNEWLEDALLVFADENAWSNGDKQQDSNLKALVTEPHVLVMKSFCEDVKHVNHIHLILSSNNASVVPVGSSNSRFIVFDVNPKCDFTELADLCETKVFRETLLCYLDKHVDLTDFVALEGCVKSLLPSLDPIPAWLYNVLSNGHLDPFLGKLEVGRSTSFTKSSVYEFFTNWCRAQKKQIPSEDVFFNNLKDVQCSETPQMIVFPPLEDARRYFSEYVSTPINIMFDNNTFSSSSSSSSSSSE